jgi:ribosomal protein S18 acetylase RimI-like enzyme
MAGRRPPADAVLDNPIWAALSGPLRRFAEIHGRAGRFRPDVSPFAGLADPADPAAWADLAVLVPAGEPVAVSARGLAAPPGWTPAFRLAGVQLVGAGMRGEPDGEAVVLTAADRDDVLDLVERTRPGPFRERTMELGTYLGIRRAGALIAMAGERLRGPGWTEISAVCTDPAYRGQGLAGRLIRAVAAGIQARGETPFLASVAENTSAIRLYEHLGFTRRAEVEFTGFQRDA